MVAAVGTPGHLGARARDARQRGHPDPRRPACRPGARGSRPAASDAQVPHRWSRPPRLPRTARHGDTGRAVGRLVHRHLRGLPVAGPRHRARRRRLRTAGHPAGRLLRPHLDHHRSARRCPGSAAAIAGRARADRRAGHTDRRGRTELSRRLALGRRRTAARRPPGERGGVRGAHVGRTAGQDPRVDAARPHRTHDRRAAALPPRQRPRVGRRRRTAAPAPARTW